MVKADDILLFVFVVEEGSFSKVSIKHEITMSVVSKRIARLEKALNVQLLYRTTRKLSLTEAGKALYQKAIIAQHAIQDAEDAVSGFGSKVKGKIRITMPVVTANLVLSNAVTEFCEQYPGVDVELMVSNRVVDVMDEGFDLAIRTADLEDSSLIARRLINSAWIVCASPEYLQRKGTPEHPDDLQRHHCVLYKYEDKKTEAWKFQVNEEDYPVQVNSRFKSNTLDTLKQSVLTGFGIAYLPRALIHDELQSGQLVALLTPFVSKNLGIYAVYPKSRQPNKMLSLLVEHFRQALQLKKDYFY